MADWLCRLSPEEWALGQWSAEAAKALGVDGWVISVEAEGVAPQQAELLGEMLESPDGLPVVLEWCLSEHCGLASLQQKLDGIGPWLQHPRAYRIAGLPLLLIRGCEHLGSEPSVADRLQQLFREQGCDPLPWLVPCCSSSVDGFDGVYEEVLLPERSSQPSSRANYELHLRNAHWHESPHGWHIPAVRALAANDWDRYCNATAKRYREWLRLVSHWSVLQRNGDLRSPVLLESWSGHRRWWSDDGEIQLIADSSSEPITSTVQELSWGECSAENLALMVHGYYLDGLASMLHRLDPRAEPSIDLYVSTPIRQLHAVANVLRRQGWPRVHLFGVPNRGRDLAPFVRQLLPAALSVGHLAFLKVHTKSSPHLAEGKDWGHHLLSSILNPDLMCGLQQRLQNDSELGLLAPAGTVMPITVQLHNNGKHLAALQHRWGTDAEQLLDSRFIAGSMFAGRLASLEPLYEHLPELSCFEAEAGQTDGTLAHALERWIGVILHKSGQRMEELPGNPQSVPCFGFRWADQPEDGGINAVRPLATSGCSKSQPIDTPLVVQHRQEGLLGMFPDVSDRCEQKNSAGLDLSQSINVFSTVQALADAHGWSLQKLVAGSYSLEELQRSLVGEAIASRQAGAATFSRELMTWALAAGFPSPWLRDNLARALLHLQRPEEACELWRQLAEFHDNHEVKAAAKEMLSRCVIQNQLEAALMQGNLPIADQWLDSLLEQGQGFGPHDWQSFVASLDDQGLIPWLLPLLESRIDTQPSDGLFRLIDGLRLLRGDAHLDQLLRVSQDQLLAFGWRAAAGEAVLLARTSTGRWIQARSTGPNLSRPDVSEQLQLPALSDAGFLSVLALEPGESLTGLWLQGHQQALDVRDLRGLPYIGVVDQMLLLCQAGLTPLERAPALFEAGIGQALQSLAAPLSSQQHWQELIHRREHFGVVMRDAEITVVIPLYRRWDFILGHVAGFCEDPWFQARRVRLLYVIDDPTIETEVLGWCRGQLTDELLDVSVISLQRNSGFALASNCGVLAAETPYVCLLNSDVLPIQPGWLQPMFRTLLMMPQALLAPLLLTDEGRIQHAGMTAQPLGLQDLPACVHSLKGLDPSQLKTLSPDGLSYDVELLSGAALMFERRRFLELGGFDPVFGRGDFEDLDFSIRWKRAGGRLQLVPSARLTHLERQSITHSVDLMAQWRGLLNAWQAKALCAEELA
ncbi:rhamnan synthesis F family protein [Synechococcus sp. A15-127]|uniref:rhamnan synthesis F family protein n=1 Tax=Synechococcus sp. A15-127 TaxID=1050624 RepID=UPI0016485450|nr:rhamnan synthesis F family protein [Synechococcus sp. A15-127]